MNAAGIQTLLDGLEGLRSLALDLARQSIYLDPHSDLPDDQARMFCSCCGSYGDSVTVFQHRYNCIVGQIIERCCVHRDSYIEYDLGYGQKLQLSHAEAARAHALGLWGAR